MSSINYITIAKKSFEDYKKNIGIWTNIVLLFLIPLLIPSILKYYKVSSIIIEIVSLVIYLVVILFKIEFIGIAETIKKKVKKNIAKKAEEKYMKAESIINLAVLGIITSAVFYSLTYITSKHINIYMSLFYSVVLLLLVYVLLRLSMATYAIVLDYRNIIDSLKMSWKITKGKALYLLFILIMLSLMNILGAITIIGILFTIPYTTIYMVYLYGEFKKNK